MNLGSRFFGNIIRQFLCGAGVVVAPGPEKVVEKGGDGPGLIVHLATAKCADHLPLYRLERALAGSGSRCRGAR
jgi:transposase